MKFLSLIASYAIVLTAHFSANATNPVQLFSAGRNPGLTCPSNHLLSELRCTIKTDRLVPVDHSMQPVLVANSITAMTPGVNYTFTYGSNTFIVNSPEPGSSYDGANLVAVGAYSNIWFTTLGLNVTTPAGVNVVSG